MGVRRAANLLLLGVAILGLVTGDLEKDFDKDEEVFVLTAKNFKDFLKAHPLALVEFYAPWCGHCQKLEPEYSKAAKTLHPAGKVALAKCDATAHGELAAEYAVQGYPTLKFFRDGVPTDYTGGRTNATIVQWIETMTGDAVVMIDEKEAKAPEKGITFVARVKKGKADKYKPFELFDKVADKNRMVAKFAVVVSDSAKDDVTVYRPDEEPVSTPIGNNLETLEKWVNAEKFPLLGPIDGDTFASYDQRGLEIVWFAGKPDDFAKHGAEVREAAKQFRDKYSIVWLDTDKFAGYSESGLGITTLPAMVVADKVSGRWIYPEGKKFVAKEIIKFLEDLAAGKIEKTLKSEPIPEKNDEPVKVVVGKNFEEMVFQKDKDVMLEIYAPWCGHCKRLEPIYTDLATKLADHDHVVIAKMDGTANEQGNADFVVHGFPTLYWVKAGSKKPVVYNDARTLAGLVNFIKENSSKPVTVAVEKEGEKEEGEEEKDEL